MNHKDLNSNINAGFKTPKDYFENFDNHFINELKLNDTVGDSGFDVPEGYFDSFDETILQKIKDEHQPVKVIQFSRKKVLFYMSCIAAAVLLLFTVIPYFTSNDNEDVSIDLVQTHFENTDMNAYELGELLTDSDFLEEDFSIIETNFEEDQLEDYLLENSDIETIILQ